MTRWHDVNGIYQIYPRSFKDTNNDGIGDLAGIIKKLDYIKNGSSSNSLGIDAIWISPFYPSPMADFGYDVSNYCDVDPLFGDLEDFMKLIVEAHVRSIKVMIDFVPNHTSDQHAWFQESRSSRDNPKRDWYVWRDPKPDGSPPNNWLSVFGGSAWKLDDATGQYYLHSFLDKQPDLNAENPDVRGAMDDVMRFWLELGVDGIRADAVRWISKDYEKLRDNPPNPKYREGIDDPYHSQLQIYSRYGSKLFDYLKQMSDVVAKYPDRIILFEDYPDPTLDLVTQYSHFYAVNPEVAAPFNFEGFGAPYDAEHFRSFLDKFQTYVGSGSRPFYCFGNHDNPRLASRIGRSQAKLVGLLQLTLPGIPVIYYGDEIGMEDLPIAADKIQDPFEKLEPGFGLGRDPERAPMQWTDRANAGFTQGNPWLSVVENYHALNVDSELDDPTSFLHMYQTLLGLRRMPVLRSGTYEEWMGCTRNLFGFFREDSHNKLLIVLNMSAHPTVYNGDVFGKILFSTHAMEHDRIEGATVLQAHHGIVIHC